MVYGLTLNPLDYLKFCELKLIYFFKRFRAFFFLPELILIVRHNFSEMRHFFVLLLTKEFKAW